MKRRIFLGTLAAAGLAGGTAGRAFARQVARQQPQFKPPPRWEWEVGEWKGNQREWRASVDAMPFEFSPLWNGEIYTNDRPFCGVRPGHFLIGTMTAKRIPHGLIVWTASLLERKMLCDRVTFPTDNGKTICIQLWERTNFYDLFRGEHEVTLGPSARKQLGIGYLCFAHGGSRACERQNMEHGLECPRCN